jgi:hypothetical protein
MGYRFLADLVVAVHVLYVGFIVVGQAATLVGIARNWRWVRNPWFRYCHCGAIVVVAAEALLGIACPLTVWEDRLRGWAGEEVTAGSFIGRSLHNLIFYDLPTWVFTVVYVGFAALVLVTAFLAPPERKTPRKPNLAQHPNNEPP